MVGTVKNRPREKQKETFLSHVAELRRRVFIIVLVLLIGSAIGYWLYPTLLELIRAPLGEDLFYTSPAGGFSFTFTLSVLFGLVCVLPVVIFQAIRFVEPAVRKFNRRLTLAIITSSTFLAVAGILFAYFVSLPAALHFLGSFEDEGIRSIITADAYFSFAAKYLLGFAILFQLPLIVLLINKIKPLKPGGMLGAGRFIILGSFILAAILTPTADPINQALMAVPIIVLYLLSIVLVAVVNHKKPTKTDNAKRTITIPVHYVEQTDAAPVKRRKILKPIVAVSKITPIEIMFEPTPVQLVPISVTRLPAYGANAYL